MPIRKLVARSRTTPATVYTEQDQQGALDGSGMYIGVGHLSGDDAKGIAVGHILRAASESEGLSVEWDGMIHTRLFVKGFRWQRRSSRQQAGAVIFERQAAATEPTHVPPLKEQELAAP